MNPLAFLLAHYLQYRCIEEEVVERKDDVKFDQFSVGQRFITNSVQVKKKEIIDFGIKYDPQYFHISEEEGKDSIFGEIIAPSALILNLLWKEWVMLNILGKDCLSFVGMDDVTFHKPVFPNDTLYAEVSVEKLFPIKGEKRGILSLKLIGKKQSDETVLSSIFNIMMMR